MTDNEIIKVLECCGKEYSCEKCALNTWLDKKRDCIGAILVNALDLINRLQDEKQALINGQETLQKHLTDKQGQIEKFEKIEHFATKTIDTQHAEIERLKHRKTELQIRNQELQHEKSEAIKEFVEKFAKALSEFDMSSVGLPDYDRGYKDCMTAIEDTIDSLVKMTEV